eukprot:TRINITY_DN10820_c0_g3_i1.p1 TRINITY_DN10820_c0_g3~~TRINITY_DN10820_c0_g3_i1.p1  ORF type:complete len:369 (-),score=76.06 TRINITY_DN10820_c0_g3_i1:442-1428(-)
MQRRLKNPGAETRLVYYYPIDEILTDYIIDKSFEGDLQTTRLWSTTTVSGAPDDLLPPQIVHASSLGIPPVIICDKNSYYNKLSTRCERDNSQTFLSLEQSTATFVLPLSQYQFTSEWTLSFWLLIDQLVGNTLLFSQACDLPTDGTVSLMRIESSSLLRFSVAGAEDAITVPSGDHRWFHYSFVNSAPRLLTMGFRDGVAFAGVGSQAIPLPSCDITVGQNSDANTLIGKFKGFAIWNTAMTGDDISRNFHRTPLFPTSTFAFYLPMDEGSGKVMVERVGNREVPVSVKTYSRRVWTSQGELKICHPAYVYSAVDDACICTSFGYLI